jgi:hypothetical protein
MSIKEIQKKNDKQEKKRRGKRERKLKRKQKCVVFFGREFDEGKKKGMKGLVKGKVGNEGLGEGKSKG